MNGARSTGLHPLLFLSSPLLRVFLRACLHMDLLQRGHFMGLRSQGPDIRRHDSVLGLSGQLSLS